MDEGTHLRASKTTNEPPTNERTNEWTNERDERTSNVA